MAVILQTAKCHHNQGTDSLGQGDTWESGIITVAEKEVCIPFLMQLDQLWLCLIGVLLSIHHFSTLDKEILLSRVLETFSQLSKLQGQGHWKIRSGESVTWLVSNCDVTAGLLPLRYIFVWQKLYVWLYHDRNHNKPKPLLINSTSILLKSDPSSPDQLIQQTKNLSTLILHPLVRPHSISITQIRMTSKKLFEISGLNRAQVMTIFLQNCLKKLNMSYRVHWAL